MKNKLSKIIPYLFVLIMLVGFFGVTNKAQADSSLCEIHFSPITVVKTASDGVVLSVTVIVDRVAEDNKPTDPNHVIVGKPEFVDTCGSWLRDGELNSWNAVARTVGLGSVDKDGNRIFPLANNEMWIDVGENYDATKISANPITTLTKRTYIHPNVLKQTNVSEVSIFLPKSATPKTYYAGVGVKKVGLTPLTDYEFYYTAKEINNGSGGRLPNEFYKDTNVITLPPLPNDDSTIHGTPKETNTGTGADTALGVAIADLECLKAPFSINIPNCIVGIAYPVFFQLPAFILATTAKLFNGMLSLTISSKLYTQSTFIPEAWAIVRDISNIFFILILLYTAMQVILGWSHDTRKIIAQVVIMAMLINFSMFFTEVVIDSSNVLALIFFNKIAVKGANNAPIPYQPSFNSGIPEKDMGGAIASGFNPAGMMKPEMFQARTIPIPGPGNKTATIPQPGASFFLAIIFVSGAIFLYASYAFFIAAISFLGRLIELWILIIFSPFAFMSSALPALDHIEGFGWKKWLDKLLTVAFMAPVFMFFMYVITKIISKMDVFTGMQNTTSSSAASDLLIIIIPAIISITLLMKAVSYAKKGGGQFSNAIMTAGKMVGGLAIGAATGGASMLGTGLIGGGANALLTSKVGEKLREKTNQKGMGGWAAKMALKTSDYATKASFDVTKAPGATKDFFKGLGKKEGGFKGATEKTAKKEAEEKDLYKTKLKTDDQVKEWSKERTMEYNANMAEAERSKGRSFTDKEKIEYEEKHPKPKEYTSVDQLNHSREKAYQDNLGLQGLLGSMAFSSLAKISEKAGGLVKESNFSESKEYKENFAKKYGAGEPLKYEEGIANEINKKRAKRAKVLVGAGAAIATGGTAGAALGGAGIMGGGMALGGASAASHGMKQSAGEAKLSDEITKHDKDLQKITDRITSIKNLLEKGKGADMGAVVSEIDGKLKVDQEKLEQTIAGLEFERQKGEIRLKDLIARGVPDNDSAMVDAKVAAINTMTKTAELKKLRTAEKEMYDLGKDMSSFNEHSQPAAATHAAPTATAPAAHAPAPTPPPAASSSGGAAPAANTH